jgi:hypothetical protein
VTKRRKKVKKKKKTTQRKNDWATPNLEASGAPEGQTVSVPPAEPVIVTLDVNPMISNELRLRQTNIITLVICDTYIP